MFKKLCERYENSDVYEKLTQQKFAAFRPEYQPQTVCWISFLLGLFFLTVGLVVLKTTVENQEHSLSYAKKCMYNTSLTCDSFIRTFPGKTCHCTIYFNLTEAFPNDAVFFYGLDKFYQNNRYYFHSRDDSQLHGNVESFSKPSQTCDPFTTERSSSNMTIEIMPCGAIANSIFNDTFALFFNSSAEILIDRNISLINNQALRRKYRNPRNLTDLKGYGKPSYWSEGFFKEFLQFGLTYLPFVVWMQPAAIPTFRKVYGKATRNSQFSQTLPKGEYTLFVDYNYGVGAYNGDKRFIIDSVSWMGPKRHLFLPCSYMAFGGIQILFAFFVLVLYCFKKRRRKISDSRRRSYGSTSEIENIENQ